MGRLSAALRAFVLLSVAFGLCGCAGFRLYDSDRDKKAQAATKAWSEVKLDTIIAGERGNLDKLRAEELETQDRLALALREYILKDLFSAASIRDGLSFQLSSRLVSLTGSVDGMKKVLAARLELRKHARRFEEEASPLRLAGLPVPNCEDLGKDNLPKIRQWLVDNPAQPRAGVIRSTVTKLKATCDQSPSGTEQQLLMALGGELGSARDEKIAAEKQLASRRQAGKAAQDAFNKANKDHSDAVARATSDPDRAAKVKTAAETLQKAAEALGKVGDAFSTELISEARLKAIDDFANVIIQTTPGKDPPDSASRAAKAAALLPALFDEAEKAFADARKPLILPWTLQRDHQQLNLEAARRDIAASEAIVRLSGELIDVMLVQAESLTLALDELALANARLGDPLLTVLSRGSVPEKQAVYFAATRYLDAVGRLDSKRYRVEYARVSAYHERSLSLSDVNVKQWESLIAITVAQLAEDGASGLKAEDFGSLLNTLGIFYIGRGVNK